MLPLIPGDWQYIAECAFLYDPKISTSRFHGKANPDLEICLLQRPMEAETINRARLKHWHMRKFIRKSSIAKDRQTLYRFCDLV